MAETNVTVNVVDTMDFHEMLDYAVRKMDGEGIERTIHYVHPLTRDGLIPRVTVEWVSVAETE